MEPDGNSSIEVVCRVHSFRNQLFGLQLGLKDSVHIEGNKRIVLMGPGLGLPPPFSQDEARIWTCCCIKGWHWETSAALGHGRWYRYLSCNQGGHCLAKWTWIIGMLKVTWIPMWWSAWLLCRSLVLSWESVTCEGQKWLWMYCLCLTNAWAGTLNWFFTSSWISWMCMRRLKYAFTLHQAQAEYCPSND
jgi:hypothetical protein